MNIPIKWAAELSHVREVSLIGTADTAYWTERLAEEGLRPVDEGGRARIMIVSAAGKYLGLRFRELSFSIPIHRRRENSSSESVFLFQAFNSSRLLAFCERRFFSTPYTHAEVHLSASLPASIRLGRHGGAALEARMRPEITHALTTPIRQGEEGWEGAILLPRGQRQGRGKNLLFFGRICGFTRTYPFLASRDSLTLNPLPGCEAPQALLESDYAATEWIIREDALHARSRTYKASDFQPIG